jgi:trk system potassium uptake protein TrkA
VIVGESSPAAGKRVDEVPLPEGSLIISILRSGTGFVPKPDSMIQAGDEVLVVLDPGLEGPVTAHFAATDGAATGG